MPTKTYEDLIDQVLSDGANGHLLNTVMEAGEYSYVLEAVVLAGGTGKLARSVSANLQVITHALKDGFLSPIYAVRVADKYGIPVDKLVEAKYADVLAAAVARKAKGNK